jgi:hypothetical protein
MVNAVALHSHGHGDGASPASHQHPLMGSLVTGCGMAAGIGERKCVSMCVRDRGNVGRRGGCRKTRRLRAVERMAICGMVIAGQGTKVMLMDISWV